MRCIDKPGIILFAKDATCFARMPYHYKILVYKLTVSTPNKTYFISARPVQLINICESTLTSQLRFGSIFLYSIFFILFIFLSNSLAVDESGDV